MKWGPETSTEDGTPNGASDGNVIEAGLAVGADVLGGLVVASKQMRRGGDSLS